VTTEAKSFVLTDISDHALVLSKLYSELTLTIDAQTVAGYMFQHNELTKRDLDSIQSIRGEPIRSAERLLDIVIEQPRSVYWSFLDALKEAGQDNLRRIITLERSEGQLNASETFFLLNFIHMF